MAVLRSRVGGNDLWITQMAPEVNTASQTGFAGLIRVHPFIRLNPCFTLFLPTTPFSYDRRSRSNLRNP